MVVSQIMNVDVATCTPRMDLAQVIQTMVERDCGFLPVVGPYGSVIGVLTDRDVCFTLTSHRRTAAHVTVEEAMHTPVHTCSASDSLIDALGTMSRYRIRRLPVVDRTGTLQGILSIDDVILATIKPGAPTGEDVVETLRVICRPREVEPTAASNPG